MKREVDQNGERQRLDLAVALWTRLSTRDEDAMTDEESEAHIDVLGFLNSLSIARVFVSAPLVYEETPYSDEHRVLLERLEDMKASHPALGLGNELYDTPLTIIAEAVDELRGKMRAWAKEASRTHVFTQTLRNLHPKA